MSLEDAFLALREHEIAGDGAPTRRAVLLAASTKRRRRLVALRFVVPLAAVLAASTAWAAATGRLPRAFSAASSLLFSTREHELPPAPPAVAIAPRPDTSAVVPELEPVTVDELPAASAAPKPPPRVVVAVDDREDTLYRAAHEAHFVTKDSARALAGWDAYLAAFPKGRFAPDARYNRAIALVRLGRRDEARTALRPFAAGAFGGYRAHEAQELLDALE